MPQGNVDIVRRAYGAMNDRDWSKLDEFLHPDVELDLSRNILNPNVYRGHDGFEQLVAAIEDVWDDFHFELGETIESEDRVVVAIKILGKGKGSGVPAEMELFNVWTLRDGKASRLAGGFRSRSEALDAAGLAADS